MSYLETHKNLYHILCGIFFSLSILSFFWYLFVWNNYNTKEYKKQRKLRAIKITTNDNSVIYIVQQKIRFTNWFRFLGKWYSLAEDGYEYSSPTKYNSLEDAENRIKKLILQNAEENMKKYNRTIKETEVVIITK